MPTSRLTLANQRAYAEVEALRGKTPIEIRTALEQACARAAAITVARTSDAGRADTEVLSFATIEPIVALEQAPTVKTETVEADEGAVGAQINSTDCTSLRARSLSSHSSKPTFITPSDFSTEAPGGGNSPPGLSFPPPLEKFPLNAIRMGGVTIAPSETWASPDF